jgi:hypothetical protein
MHCRTHELALSKHADVLNAANRVVVDVQFPTHDGAFGKNWLLNFGNECSSNWHFLLQSAYNEKNNRLALWDGKPGPSEA